MAPINHPDSRSSDPFERLHPEVREWIWNQGWQQLRPTQARAIPPILAGDRDVIVSAATASGKTEAAWLPICSALGHEADRGEAERGVKALYIGPLKALINDQHDRLRGLAEGLAIPVHRRHGDVTGSERAAIARSADGILLITPESFEALFVLQGSRIPGLFHGLRYVVIDELHAFIGTERGAQLQSLLHRLELAIRRRVPRVALSATLADPGIAGTFLRPAGELPVEVITGEAEGESALRMQLRGYRRSGASGEAEPDHIPTDQAAIAEHLFTHLRGHDNLVFTNARSAVETYADALKRMCDERRLPNEFFPHHGSLARELREDVEAQLKEGERPTTAICTSTLEMGIDIGSVDSVAQIGAPPSVASLRQRLGRSGRRGDPAVLRVYVSEREVDPRTAPADGLRGTLVQAVAMIDLVLEKWYEHPNTASLHLSTLIQQILSVIAQHGGATASELYRTLCGQGPFSGVTQNLFTQLLRDLGAAEVIVQAGDATLLPGVVGERIVNHYSFYAAFQTPVEYRLLADGRTLGSIPVDFPLLADSLIVFAGRRWRVLAVDDEALVILLAPARGGNPPLFGGAGAEVADEVRRRMRATLESDVVPVYLDRVGRELLAEGRAHYARLRLAETRLLASGKDTVVFPWRGDRVMNTLMVLMLSKGLKVADDRLSLTCEDADPATVRDVMAAVVNEPMPPGPELARHVLVKRRDKYDHFLGDALLDVAYAARDLDLPGACAAFREILESGVRGS